MFLHIGLDKVIRTQDVLGIFDLDTSTVGKPTRTYLAKSEKAGEVENVCTDLPKSFIVCKAPGEKGKKVYISQLSTQTLLKRTQSVMKNDF